MYIELHSRSAFSFLEGSSLPEELAGMCAELGMPAMALLDRDGVYGAPRFHLAATKIGVRAHIGAEIQFQVSGFEFQDQCRTETQDASHKTRNLKLKTRNCFFETGNSKLLCRLPLLVASRTGYQNLCRLITRMKMRGPKDARPEQIGATPTDLAEYNNGLICLTGGDEGVLAAALARGGIKEARRAVEQFITIFGHQNVYVELQRHFHREEEVRNQAALEIARTLRLPILATNGVCYAAHSRIMADGRAGIEEREILDVFTCLRNHKTLETAGRLLARNSERYLKSPAEMARLFTDLPKAIANTQELSSRLEFTLNDLGYEFPKYPVPETETMMSFLRQRTEEGFRERYGRATRDLQQRARRQIERELVLIEKLELAGYFLIVWDIVRYCRENSILVQGRGSAANSAVCYSLGITAVDPVGMELLFERFLSEERGEWPDVDLDLPSGDQRERAIQYIYQRYGRLGAAMTANVITYRGRSAAREMGKVLGFDVETLDRLSGLVGSWEYKDPSDTLERQFHQAGFDLRHPRMRKYLELCLAVQDLPRHLGQHSGGMVICQGQLDSVVPLEPATMPGRVVVQWDKEDCADMGIIKVDLLGLGMMAVLEDCLKLIPEHYTEQVDLAYLPPDNPQVYAALQQADTVGMFQIESRAQMSCLPRLRPACFYDIVVQVAIIRPGPIVGEMVNPYIKRRQGREEVIYPHPSLETVLSRTLGVPLFQEQLLRMAMIAAGFTGGEAEELRRAFGFKRSEARMRDIEVKLRAGMERNGIASQAQEQIIQSITSFALYGFPESHAASFALLAYASAYLKCHYLAAFTAALLNNQPMGFYSPATIVKDAQRHGLKIKPIDIAKSDWLCTLEQWPVTNAQWSGDRREAMVSTPELRVADYVTEATPDIDLRSTTAPAFSNGSCKASSAATKTQSSHAPVPSGTTCDSPGRKPWESALDNPSPVGTAQTGAAKPRNPKLETALRLGLRYVKGLREEVAKALVCERENRPFTFIEELTQRVPQLRKNELVTLAEIGALNSLATDNWQLHFHRRDALWQVERAMRRSGPLLEGISQRDHPSPLAQMTNEERLVADFRGTGLTVGKHPMAYHRQQMQNMGVHRAIDLQRIPNGKHLRIAGSVIARQRPGTAHGFVFLSLEDETGIANAIITPDLFEKNRLLLIREQFLMIEGKLQNLDNVISVKAGQVMPLKVTNAATESHDFH